MGLSKPNAGTSTTPSGAQASQTPVFAPCSRSEFTTEHNDWITFVDTRFKAFDICPSCFTTSIAHTPHAVYFERSAPKLPNIGYSCDFSRYWVRIAWCWILARSEEADISLLATVAVVEGADGPCPNGIVVGAKGTAKTPATRPWYTILDPDMPGTLFDQFTICGFCLNCIYTIFPTIHSALPFVSASDTHCEGTCDIFAGASARTSAYTNILMMAELSAQQPGGVLDLTTFTQLVKRFAGLAECGKDDPVRGNFYSMSQIPNFKVCEECFEDIVRPDVGNGAQLALSFGAPVYTAEGFTCQLYSERLRKIWSEAVRCNDLDYLRQSITARSAKEVEITMQLAPLKQQFSMQLQQAKHQDQMALMEQMSQQSRNLAAQMSTGHIQITDFSQVNRLFQQGQQCRMQALQTAQQVDRLTAEWKDNWE